jgi:hypothetical protein
MTDSSAVEGQGVPRVREHLLEREPFIEQLHQASVHRPVTADERIAPVTTGQANPSRQQLASAEDRTTAFCRSDRQARLLELFKPSTPDSTAQ